MRIVSIALSKKKGTRKRQVKRAAVVENHGIEGDAHAGSWHRQISFLDIAQIEKCRSAGLEVSFGDFAENIATESID